MAELTAHPHAIRRSPLEVVVDRVWRFFCSVRAAVYEVSLLALFVLLGTLRGSSVPNSIAAAIPATQPIIDRWYAWNVFHSLPFMFLLALIAVAIAVCTMNRGPAIWKAIAHPTVTTTRGFLHGAEVTAAYRPASERSETVERMLLAMRTRRYRVLTEERDGETHVYADKNRFAKLGTFPFHLALIMLLVGGIVGARYGFRNNEFPVPEGGVRPVGHGTGLSVGVDRFTDTYRENGQAREYKSDLTIYKGGQAVKRGSITVNHPLTYGNVVVYQSGFGQAVALKVTDQSGNVVLDDSLPLGQFTSKQNPDAPAAQQVLPSVNATLNVIAPDTNAANLPELDTLHLMSGQMYVQIRPDGAVDDGRLPGTVVDQAQTVTLDGLNIEFIRERQFSGLQIASNPGIPIFWAAAILMVAGLAVVFYFPHRRIRGIVRAEHLGAGSSVLLAPLAKRDWSGKRDFHRLAEDLRGALGAVPEIRTRETGDDERLKEVGPTVASSSTA